MHKELLAHSNVLALPLAALLLFVCVFVVIVVRTMLRRPAAYSDLERLPLSNDEGRVEPEVRHGDA